MAKLGREVRFSINPFLGQDVDGFNSYSSKPCGQGLALFFSLVVELDGEVDGETGFVVNVSEIDKVVRQNAVVLFGEKIREKFGAGEHVGLFDLAGLLGQSWGAVDNAFEKACLSRLVLNVNPFRKIWIEREDFDVLYYSEKFEFAAMHRLWNDKFSDDRNLKEFGKCANPAGHGHNYVVEVTVRCDIDGPECDISDFQEVVEREFVGLVDHKNLNVDVAGFGGKNPTVENIAAFGWERLFGKFASGELCRVTVWENDRTYCTFEG